VIVLSCVIWVLFFLNHTQIHLFVVVRHVEHVLHSSVVCQAKHYVHDLILVGVWLVSILHVEFYLAIC